MVLASATPGVALSRSRIRRTCAARAAYRRELARRQAQLRAEHAARLEAGMLPRQALEAGEEQRARHHEHHGQAGLGGDQRHPQAPLEASAGAAARSLAEWSGPDPARARGRAAAAPRASATHPASSAAPTTTRASIRTSLRALAIRGSSRSNAGSVAQDSASPAVVPSAARIRLSSACKRARSPRARAERRTHRTIAAAAPSPGRASGWRGWRTR